jgi:hypothetical protein
MNFIDIEKIPERTWLVAGAVVLAGPALLLYAVLVFPAHSSGMLYVSVSDISRDLRGVREVSMTVHTVELHSPKNGWVTVVSTPTSFDLLGLKASGAMQLAGNAKVAAGLYDQVRVTLGPVHVHMSDGVTNDAVLGSSSFTIAANTVINTDGISHINIDVNTGSSLYKAVGGTYVFAPVVVFRSEDGVLVSIDAGNTIIASGGTVDARVAVGSDFSGATYRNAALAKNTRIVVADAAAKIDSPTERALVQIGPDGNRMGE